MSSGDKQLTTAEASSILADLTGDVGTVGKGKRLAHQGRDASWSKPSNYIHRSTVDDSKTGNAETYHRAFGRARSYSAKGDHENAAAAYQLEADKRCAEAGEVARKKNDRGEDVTPGDVMNDGHKKAYDSARADAAYHRAKIPPPPPPTPAAPAPTSGGQGAQHWQHHDSEDDDGFDAESSISSHDEHRPEPTTAPGSQRRQQRHERNKRRAAAKKAAQAQKFKALDDHNGGNADTPRSQHGPPSTREASGGFSRPSSLSRSRSPSSRRSHSPPPHAGHGGSSDPNATTSHASPKGPPGGPTGGSSGGSSGRTAGGFRDTISQCVVQ